MARSSHKFLWHPPQGPGTVKTVPYRAFYIAPQTYKCSVGRDALIPPQLCSITYLQICNQPNLICRGRCEHRPAWRALPNMPYNPPPPQKTKFSHTQAKASLPNLTQGCFFLYLFNISFKSLCGSLVGYRLYCFTSTSKTWGETNAGSVGPR